MSEGMTTSEVTRMRFRHRIRGRWWTWRHTFKARRKVWQIDRPRTLEMRSLDRLSAYLDKQQALLTEPEGAG